MSKSQVELFQNGRFSCGRRERPSLGRELEHGRIRGSRGVAEGLDGAGYDLAVEPAIANGAGRAASLPCLVYPGPGAIVTALWSGRRDELNREQRYRQKRAKK